MNARIDPNDLRDDPSNEQRQSDSLIVQEKILNAPTRLSLANHLVNRLIEEHSAIEAFVLLKQAEAIIKDAIEIQKEGAVTAADEKESIILGAKVETKHVRQWEYENSRLDSIAEEIKKLKAEEKDIQTLLQKLKEPMASTESGEILQPAKLIKDGRQIAVTLPK